jgi:hypothetical protein
VRGGKIFDDEQQLAAADEPQIAARNRFDRRGIFTKPARVLAQPRVLLPQRRNPRRELVVTAPRAAHLEQTTLAEHRVGHQYAAHKQDQGADERTNPHAGSGWLEPRATAFRQALARPERRRGSRLARR